MSQHEVLHTANYDACLREYASDELLNKLDQREQMLATFPDMGSPLVRPSVTAHYGEDARKLVIGGYVIFYRHTGDKVYMLAIVPARTIR